MLKHRQHLRFHFHQSQSLLKSPLEKEKVWLPALRYVKIRSFLKNIPSSAFNSLKTKKRICFVNFAVGLLALHNPSSSVCFRILPVLIFHSIFLSLTNFGLLNSPLLSFLVLVKKSSIVPNSAAFK